MTKSEREKKEKICNAVLRTEMYPYLWNIINMKKISDKYLQKMGVDMEVGIQYSKSPLNEELLMLDEKGQEYPFANYVALKVSQLNTNGVIVPLVFASDDIFTDKWIYFRINRSGVISNINEIKWMEVYVIDVKILREKIENITSYTKTEIKNLADQLRDNTPMFTENKIEICKDIELFCYKVDGEALYTEPTSINISNEIIEECCDCHLFWKRGEGIWKL